MIVVSNTSPITNLAAIGLLDLIPKLFGNIYIPDAVWLELSAKDNTCPGYNELKNANWVNKNKITNHELVTILLDDLDLGESETIVLSLELKADLVLLDEIEGRKKAKRLGLNVIGVVGVLLKAKSEKLILSIHPILDRLIKDANFYLSDEVIQEALRLANELK